MDKAEGDAYLERVKEGDGDGERDVAAIKFIVDSLQPIIASRQIRLSPQLHDVVVSQMSSGIARYFTEHYPELTDRAAMRAKGAEVRRKVVEYLIASEQLEKGVTWDEEAKTLRDAAGNPRGGLAEALAAKEPLHD